MADDVETKLSAARTRLILDKPFLGALVLRLPMKAAAANWCPTTATDARAFYYNRDYIAGKTLAETQFILAHEALHCALSHFARRQHRNKLRWDVACDLAVNPLLIGEGLTAPADYLHLPEFDGMTAEEIYPCLDEHPDAETPDQHIYDDSTSEGGTGGGRSGEGDQKSGGQNRAEGESSQGMGNRPEHSDRNDGSGSQPDRSERGEGEADRPPPLSAEEREQLAVTWRQRMAGAAQQAMQVGKMGGALARMIDHLLQPQLPWRMLLARYMNATARDDYNWSRPSRREGDFILPSLRSHEIDVVIAVDISGSVGDEEMREFVSEVDAIKGQARARITLIPCDARVAEGAPWEFAPWEEFRLPRAMQGGGGTDFRPVFDLVERRTPQPDLLVYFTDAEGQFPTQPPTYPVVWLVKGKRPVPWGERVQLN